MELRQTFNKLQERLNYLRGEWIRAHENKDLSRETELINRETALFDQVNDVIAEFAQLMRRYGPSGKS